MERIEVSCNICGSDYSRLLVIKNSFQVVKCRECGLVYVSPRLTEAALGSIYSEDYHISSPAEVKEERVGFFKEKIVLISQYQAGGKILDVGCSTGSFLKEARSAGWDTYGIDVSEDALQYARGNYGLEVTAGKLDDSEFEPAFFDAITMLDSIEHMPDPYRALLKAKEILKPDGFIFISTPNIDGLIPLTTYCLFGRTFGIWEHPTPPGHIYQFSEKTLTALLNKAGFDVVAAYSENIPFRYTFEKLEEAAIDKIKEWSGESGNNAIRPEGNNSPSTSSSKAIPVPPSSGGILRRTIRLLIRTCSWPAIFPIYSLSNFLKRGGDSIFVVARPGS
ncbi:MAG: class I SAM-dependent methyltransferase [bacterium]|nr:class I SAM-dependent methyltransferase [bacterium]